MPLKREFTSYWRPVECDDVVGDDRFIDFFGKDINNHTPTGIDRITKCTAIVPEGIPYQDLAAFSYKKTRITIEVIE